MDTRRPANPTPPEPAVPLTPSSDPVGPLQAELKASLDSAFAALTSASDIPEGGLLIEDPDDCWFGFLRRRSAKGQLYRCKQYADSIHDSLQDLLINHPEWAVRAEVVALVQRYSM